MVRDISVVLKTYVANLYNRTEKQDTYQVGFVEVTYTQPKINRES
jgi:hypothetical protein